MAGYSRKARLDRLDASWSVGMEATIFSGWIYDHLLPHATQIKLAHRGGRICFPK